MKLTQQQLNHFNTFGFVVFRQLLSPDEMQKFSQEFDSELDSWLPAGVHEGKARHYASLMDSGTPFSSSMMHDPRIAGVGEQLLGTRLIGVGIGGSYHVGDTAWHPDAENLDYRAIKFTTYFDPLDAKNGALRVVPGSHREPLHSSINTDTQTAFGVHPDELPAYVFETNPGDVLAFSAPIWHGAFHGGNRRRMCEIVFYEEPASEPSLTAVREQMMANQRMFAEGRAVYPGQQLYPEFWRSIEDDTHQRWIRWMADQGVLDTPTAERSAE